MSRCKFIKRIFMPYQGLFGWVMKNVQGEYFVTTRSNYIVMSNKSLDYIIEVMSKEFKGCWFEDIKTN